MSIFNFAYSTISKTIEELINIENRVKSEIDVINNNDISKGELARIINQKNILKSSLIEINNTLKNISNSATTVDTLTSSLNIAVNTIKGIPIPTSVPPGIGIPLNVITILADSLDSLSKAISKGRGVVDLITSLISQITPRIEKIISLLNSLEGFVQKEIEKYPNEEINNLVNTQNISNVSLNVGDSINGNIVDNLKPNSPNPIKYKGFRLILEYKPDNDLSITSKRIKGINDTSKQTIYNDDYSFSTSIPVLINEIKFKIDSL